MRRWPLYIVCSAALLCACGGAEFNDGEDYGNILDTDAGLILTEAEHRGWGLTECTMCHNLENIHLVNRTGIPIDIEAIHEIALTEGLDSCADCHGENGVTQ